MFPLLETLVAVYEVGQFTLAADELKVSQSTVSSRIAQLEQMVGAPLFVRNAKSDVTPTQAGRMLYQTAIGIDGLWRDTREQIARVQEAREPLAVSFSHTTAAILLPKALPVMARDMDGFDFAVHVMNSDAILEQASMKAVQLGVVEKPIVNDSVDRVTLCEDRLVLGGVPMFLSTPWGVDVSGFRLAVVGALRPAGGVRRPFPCGPVQATRAGSW